MVCLKAFKKRVHYSACDKALLLHNLPRCSLSLEQLEKEVAPISFLLDFNQQALDVEQKSPHLAVTYRQQHKAMRLDLSALERSLATF